jgi:hypothetical protein
MAIANVSDNNTEKTISLSVGFYTAIFTVIMTVVTFGFAITAIPISGANCGDLCIEYPYLNTLSQFPKDYLWMPLAIILTLSYLVLMVSIHVYASNQRKIFSQIGLSFALLATMVLVGNYFVQFSVIPISLMSGETEGITMLTQYNAHGVFIVLEELGYLLMSLSFLFVAFVFICKNRLESAICWVFVVSFLLTVIALTLISINYGLDRQDRFEVAVISIDWLVLIINGILLSIVFKRQLKKSE